MCYLIFIKSLNIFIWCKLSLFFFKSVLNYWLRLTGSLHFYLKTRHDLTPVISLGNFSRFHLKQANTNTFLWLVAMCTYMRDGTYSIQYICNLFSPYYAYMKNCWLGKKQHSVSVCVRRRIPVGLWYDGGESASSRIWGYYINIITITLITGQIMLV